MSEAFVSVVITTYNYGRFIEEAIESVFTQEYPAERMELVIVDDGSTDDTKERVEKYAGRVEYVHKANGGQASALNCGIARAKGEIVALLDADDLFVPGKLRRLAEAFQQDPAIGMVYHPMVEWEMRTKERRTTAPRLFSGDLRSHPEQFLSYPVLPASCIAFRRSNLNPLVPIPESIRMLADAYLVILVPFLAPILALAEPLTVYRIHGGNSYYADEQKMPEEARKARERLVLKLIDAVLKWVAENGWTEKQRHVRFFRNRWVLASQALGFNSDPPGRWRTCVFLLRQNYAFRSLQTWKFTTLNYVAAFSGLVLGYREAQRWRDDVLRRTQEVLRKFSRGTSNSGEPGAT